MRRVAIVVVSAAVICGARLVAAQGFQGGIRGAIHDAGGAVPGASVTLTNDSTNLGRTTITNAAGEYAFASVEPGTYTVKVSMQGYKTTERPGVRIGTQSFLVIDHTLEVGTIEESVTVSSQPAVVSTLPLTVLRDVSLDAAPELRAAISAVTYSNAGKIALQFSRRFWEEDDGIFGGITRTDQEITQILYPSTGYLSRKGILVGYYQTGPVAGPMGDLAPAERLQRAMEQGSLIHPQYASTFENAFSIAWQKVAYSKGGWAQFTEAQRKKEYLTLLVPDRGLYLAGDYTTNLSGWMCGALESARAVVASIHERARRSMTAARVDQR